jgi:hypothetical protein
LTAVVLLKSQDLGLQKGGLVGRKGESSEERKNVSPMGTSFADAKMHFALTTHFLGSKLFGVNKVFLPHSNYSMLSCCAKSSLSIL